MKKKTHEKELSNNPSWLIRNGIIILIVIFIIIIILLNYILRKNEINFQIG